MLTEPMLHRLWPHVDEAKPGLIAAVVASSADVFAKYGLDSALVVAHAMAQFSHEFGAGNPAKSIEFEENLNYSASRIAQVWPSRPSAIAFAHNPRKLANAVYNGRMGNRTGTDDGWNYRGRGGSQVTGREGYQKLAAKSGLDLLGNPDLVNSPEHFLECAVADFVLCDCLPFAQRDDVLRVTQHLNGGTIGLAQREQWLDRWKAALGAQDAQEAPAGVLRYGAKGYEVEALQRRLCELGYALGDKDGDFGPATEHAVLAFQADRGLATDGVVGPATREALKDGPPKPLAEARIDASAGDLRELGSSTVKAGDHIGTVGKITVGTGAIGLAQKSGVLDQIKDASDQVSSLKPVIGVFQDLWRMLAANWMLAALIAGGLVWYFGRDVIAKRLADHRAGINMGR